jgi:hypothetical protein
VKCYLCGCRCAGIGFAPDSDLPLLRIYLCWTCHRKCRVIWQTTAEARAAIIARWPGLTHRISTDGLV